VPQLRYARSLLCTVGWLVGLMLAAGTFLVEYLDDTKSPEDVGVLGIR
jgi:hypothetical protein